jgi:acetyl esterase/lipase
MRASWPVGVVLLLSGALAGCRSVENFYGKLDGVEHVADVAYLDDGHPKHTLDLFVPRGGKSFATVVFIHGGYWRAGDRSYFKAVTGLYSNVGTALAEHGIATVVASYRLLPDATLDDMLDDVSAALAWTRDHIGAHGGDPTALFLAGHSAGGHLVTQLGAHTGELRARGVPPEIVRGVISLSGIYDIEKTTARVSPSLRDEVFVPLFSANREQQRRASPATGFGLAAQAALAPVTGSRAFFSTIEGNRHEDMVLEIGTSADEVTPRIAAFVALLR